MTGFFSKVSILHLTLLAFMVSCSAPAPTQTIKKSSTNADAKKKKKPAASEDESGDDSSGGSTDGEDEEDTDEPADDKTDEPKEEDMKPKEPTPAENVAALDNFRWELPCEMMDGNELCFSNVKVDVTKTIAGKAADLYEVELKFRGVVEPMKYKDGQREGDRFYIGGKPDDSTYNIYAIEVSSPKQIYYLNRADNTGHDTFSINYTAKIKMNGGASIHLVGDGQNDKMIANFKNAMAPEIEKLPNDNKGQFIQMNVVGAVLSN